MELDAQYERIVRLIPVDELTSSYNSVVQEGVSSVHRAVDDVAAAFARLKEVRNAVSRLQNGRHDRSASILSTVSSISALQLELETKLDQVVGLAKEQKTRSKRRRPQQVSQVIAQALYDENNNEQEADESDSESASSSESESDSESSSDSDEEDGSGFGQEGQVRPRDEDEPDGNTTGGMFASRSALMKVVEAEESSTARVLDLSAAQESAKVSPPHSAEATSNSKTESAPGKTSKQYMTMVEAVDKLPMERRPPQIRRVLLEMSEMLEAHGPNGLREEHAVNILRCVVKWPRESASQRSLGDVYRRFLKGMSIYELGVQNAQSKARLKGLINKLFRAFEGVEKIDHASPCRAFEEGEKPGSDGIAEQVERRISDHDDNPAEDFVPNPPAAADVNRESGHVPAKGLLPRPLHQTGKTPNYYRRLVTETQRTPVQHRFPLMPPLLFALMEAMLDDVDAGRQNWQIINSVGQITEWITNGLAFRGQEIYHRCADVLISYAKQHHQVEPLQKVAENFSRTIGHSSLGHLPAINARFPRVAEPLRTGTFVSSSVQSTCSRLGVDQGTQSHFSRLVGDLSTASFETRSQHIVEVVTAFKMSISGDSEGRYLAKATQALERVLQWIDEDPPRPNIVQSYGSLFKALSGYSTQLQSETQTAELDRLLIKMSESLLKTMDLSCIVGKESKRLNPNKGSAACVTTTTETSEAKMSDGGAPHVVTSDSDSSSESSSDSSSEPSSDSESDYDDEKDAIGGSEAAWNSIVAAVADPEMK